ncbi:hypothetical protein AB0I77_21580 [Streptomyces sp. NPDC050619]
MERREDERIEGLPPEAEPYTEPRDTRKWDVLRGGRLGSMCEGL